LTKKFTPLGDRVLVRPIQPPARKGGLATPDSQKEDSTTGEVVAIGGHIHIPTNSNIQHCVEVGQMVEWYPYAGHDKMINGEKLKLLRLEEIAGVWSDE
jgi:co-chaperonin GroES (HSP10)